MLFLKDRIQKKKLGVIMDYDLSFKYHIKQVTNTLFIIFAHLDYLIAMFL